MADKRFPWVRRTNLEGLHELKSRGIHHPLDKDSGLTCYSEACSRKCRKGEDCYLPTYNPGSGNKIIAHRECVEAATRSDIAKQVRQMQVAKGILHPPKAIAGNDLQALIDRIKEAAYQQGWSEGRRALLSEVADMEGLGA